MLPEINGLPIVVGRSVPGVEHCFDNPAEVRRWLGRVSGHDGASRS
jgi:hypothetical protein